ncbi:MAG: hypothetical protein Q8P18_06700 [Pseudomonadota bacterium]|nr:hypothetical protein [Pseudomonadota bacterium]
MADFPAAMPHGPLTEVFPDVFVVEGGFRFGPGLTIGRNMTVVRQGDELTVINSVRLTPEGEQALATLGRVVNVVRIGAFHSLDDPYFVDRYKPVLWAPPGTRHGGGLQTTRELVPGQSPLDGARVFAFEKGKRPEAAIVVGADRAGGGVLVTCDSYQNWTHYDGCSLLGGLLTRAMGFGPTLIGGPWTKQMGPDVRLDFQRLLDEPFSHLVPGHGSPLADRAKEGLRTAMTNRFGVGAAGATA